MIPGCSSVMLWLEPHRCTSSMSAWLEGEEIYNIFIDLVLYLCKIILKENLHNFCQVAQAYYFQYCVANMN